MTTLVSLMIDHKYILVNNDNKTRKCETLSFYVYKRLTYLNIRLPYCHPLSVNENILGTKRK